MSEYNLFNRWRVKRKHFWLALGLGIPLVCLLTFVGMNFLSPTVGNVYTSMDQALEPGYGMAGGAPAYDTDSGGMNNFISPEVGEESAAAYDSSTKVTTTNQLAASDGAAAIVERLIVRQGNISIAVEKTRQTRDQIEDIVSELAGQGAYVISSVEEGRGENLEPYITISIRVPVDQFAGVMDQIADMGIEVDYRNETSQDVTEEYVDLAGRIDAAELSIEQLKGYMEDAEFTEDLLYAEQQLYQRQAELEALKGRQNYLAESAALSMINITLTPYELYEPIDTGWKPLVTAKQAVENLVDSMQGFADFMIVFGIAVLPWLVFFGLIIWGVVAVVRRRRSKKNAQQVE